MVNVFAAVVGVHTQDLEEEGGRHFGQYRQQIRLGDLLAAGHHLPLRHAIDGIDMGLNATQA